MVNEKKYELKYKTLLTEEAISKKDLPEDTRKKIQTLDLSYGRYTKNPDQKNMDIVTKQDIEVCDLIQNYMEEGIEAETEAEKLEREKKETEAKEAEPLKAEKEEKERKDKEEADRLAAEKAKSPEGQKEAQAKAAKIEAELVALFKSGKTSVNLSDIKAAAPTCYSVIFDSYKEGEENGIATSRYSLLEKEKEVFQLTNNN